MAQYAESSGGRRSRSRVQAGRNVELDPVGELSGFPLIRCPVCGLARVVEGRTKKDTENHGRLFFKCARNAFPKLCSYYGFEKQYFQLLKDVGVVVVRPSQWAEVVNEEEEGSVDSPNGDKQKKTLEQKMDSVFWKMNVFFACVVFMFVGGVLMYCAMK
ncbi:unnamed protein product [Urochloa decumbens]|uniref:GRF-type domain-containing protein n=1 Tax=Urochloa decumbens TaxID=240449 RepID=A0ABC9FZQ2_9POAL